MFLKWARVSKTTTTSLTGVQFHTCVDLHMRFELVGLTEPTAAHFALVGFYSCVHQQVALVILWRPKLFATLSTLMWFDTSV